MKIFKLRGVIGALLTMFMDNPAPFFTKVNSLVKFVGQVVAFMWTTRACRK